MTNKEKAAIYRAAAKLVDKGSKVLGCCAAIAKAAGHPLLDALSLSDRMQRVFEPVPGEPRRRFAYWMLEWGEDWTEETAEVRDRRVLALCFMAALADAGDL